MLLTNRTGVKNTRDLLRAFGGLNETYGCTEAEYSGRGPGPAGHREKCRGRQPQDDGGHRNKDPDLPGQGGVRYGRRQCGPAGCCLGSGKPERELCAL